MTWDVTVPAGSDSVRDGDDVIRTFKTDMQTALRGNAAEGTEAVFPGADSANPVFRYRGLRGTTGAKPAAADHGLYFNTTKNILERSNGTTWDEVSTYIPSGTKMVFYQASAPTGWTAVALNNLFLRVVTAGGTGGTTGGSGLVPSDTITLAHTHTVDSHNHTVGSHIHELDEGTLVGTGFAGSGQVLRENNDPTEPLVTALGATDSKAWTKVLGQTKASSGNTGNASPGTDSQLSNIAFQYADLIIATKD